MTPSKEKCPSCSNGYCKSLSTPKTDEGKEHHKPCCEKCRHSCKECKVIGVCTRIWCESVSCPCHEHTAVGGWEEEFIEKGAALEHARWSRWHKYFVKNVNEENMKRWDRQSDDLYEELSECEKESDRKEVREYLPLISFLILKAEKRAMLRQRHYDESLILKAKKEERERILLKTDHQAMLRVIAGAKQVERERILAALPLEDDGAPDRSSWSAGWGDYREAAINAIRAAINQPEV